MKFGQLIEYNARNLKIMQKIRPGDYFRTSFFFFFKKKKGLFKIKIKKRKDKWLAPKI